MGQVINMIEKLTVLHVVLMPLAPPGDTLDFRSRRVVKDFLGLQFLIFGFFGVRKLWQVFFWGGL